VALRGGVGAAVAAGVGPGGFGRGVVGTRVWRAPPPAGAVRTLLQAGREAVRR